MLTAIGNIVVEKIPAIIALLFLDLFVLFEISNSIEGNALFNFI